MPLQEIVQVPNKDTVYEAIKIIIFGWSFGVKSGLLRPQKELEKYK